MISINPRFIRILSERKIERILNERERESFYSINFKKIFIRSC